MIKRIFWVVLVLNAALFAFLQWGSSLMPQDGSGLQPPLHPEQIKLLGFSAPPPASTVAPASAPVAVPPPPAASASTVASAPAVVSTLACLEWGEFSGSDLARASDDLAALKLGANLAQREVEHSIGYWVYIPPPKKHGDIAKKLAQLKKRGITDSFVVQEKGKWQDAISLGIFKTEDAAKKFLDSVKSKGVKSAVIGERQTRLKFTVFSLKNPEAATLAKLADWQKDFSGIEMKAISCR